MSPIDKLIKEVLTLGISLPNPRCVPDVMGGTVVYFFGGDHHSDGGWNRQAGVMIDPSLETILYLRDHRKSGCSITSIVDMQVAIDEIQQFLSV
jgi:hypothetical protein